MGRGSIEALVVRGHASSEQLDLPPVDAARPRPGGIAANRVLRESAAAMAVMQQQVREIKNSKQDLVAIREVQSLKDQILSQIDRPLLPSTHRRLRLLPQHLRRTNLL